MVLLVALGLCVLGVAVILIVVYQMAHMFFQAMLMFRVLGNQVGSRSRSLHCRPQQRRCRPQGTLLTPHPIPTPSFSARCTYQAYTQQFLDLMASWSQSISLPSTRQYTDYLFFPVLSLLDFLTRLHVRMDFTSGVVRAAPSHTHTEKTFPGPHHTPHTHTHPAQTTYTTYHTDLTPHHACVHFSRGLFLTPPSPRALCSHSAACQVDCTGAQAPFEFLYILVMFAFLVVLVQADSCAAFSPAKVPLSKPYLGPYLGPYILGPYLVPYLVPYLGPYPSPI